MKKAFVLALAMTAISAPLTAGSEATVTASDPAGLVAALEAAGFSPKLTKDNTGDPKIEVEISGYPAQIYFYNCDETSHDGCDSLQFTAGFDREEPWTVAAAIEMSRKYRFASMSLDKEGDPWMTWDVVTGDGIPTKVFLAGVHSFGNAMDNVSTAAFADEGDE